jgi:hypothetical protein
LIVILFGSSIEKSIFLSELFDFSFLVLPPQFLALGLLEIHGVTGLRFSWILFLARAQIWIFLEPLYHAPVRASSVFFSFSRWAASI